MLTDWIQQAIVNLSAQAPPGTFFYFDFNVKSFIAVVLFGLICGWVGSLVVGNRMAFFSDAMAHCAFAGVALGLLVGLALEVSLEPEGLFRTLVLPLIMVGFGLLVGLAIAFVREQTALASDTVIGIFFAGAIGFGAVLFKVLARSAYFDLHSFLFGNPLAVSALDLLLLAGLVVITGLVLAGSYNSLVFASFNPSLARSRRVPVRRVNYLLIVLLALIVNLCLKIVGALLINALLIVPAATASYLARNLRQQFWLTTGLCLVVGLGGLLLSWEAEANFGLEFSLGGTIVVLAVGLFFLAMALVPWLPRDRPAAGNLAKD